jgi:hypothetical protein
MGIITDKINERVAEALLEVEKQTAAVAAGLAQWQNGNRLTGARPIDASKHPRLWGGSGRLVGWSLYAKGGPVELLIRDGRDAGTGDPLGGISLVDGGNSVHWLGPGGVSFGEGVYLDVQSGNFTALRGSVWLGAVD